MTCSTSGAQHRPQLPAPRNGDTFPTLTVDAVDAVGAVDADKVAAATGAYTNDDPRYLQSTGFVLAPDGTVITAVYSTGAIGRLVADDVVGLVRYAKSQS